MQKIMTSTALLFAGALLLSGCAAGGGGGTEASASADPCETVRVEVRDVSNGAQNALTAGGDPAEVQSTLEDYSERVAAIEADDDAVTEALGALGAEIDAAAEFAATLPADPEAEVDAEAVAEHQTAIQEAAAEVTSVCAAG